ncbi:MAG TPA: hypothetical protein PKC95_00725 [Thauera aminoaromatica]|nr:hypothetical protein [Thauera aminoaromatica]
MTEDDRLAEVIRQFQESCDGTQTARAASEKCRDYFDGKQWTDAEKKKLTKRGQPVITDNRIQDKIMSWLGTELATRTDPHAYPRTPQEEGAAEAATDALRYIADHNHFSQCKSQVFENMLVEGTGGAEVVVEDVRGKPQVKIRRVRWDRQYADPHSMLADFSDAMFLGVVVWMDLAVAKRKYPSQSVDFDAMMAGTFDFGDTYDDKPTLWIDRTRARIQVLEHYYRTDEGWMRCVFTRAGFVEPPALSAYRDENGRPECPLIFQSAYVDREGNRYGVVPRYLPLQDEINHRRSKALHLLTARQVVYEKGAVQDVTKARNELARPDGMVEITPTMRFDVNPTNDLAVGQFNILADTLQSMAASGPNSALQGQESKQSGRAQQVAQQAGVVQLGPVLDNLRHWQHRVMVAAWARVKQFWTEETWVRVTDNEKTRFVALNQKITRGELVVKQAKEGGATPEQLQQLVAQMAEDPAGMQEVVVNGTAEMDVDIIIDEAPDTITLQSEQWLQLTELAKNGIPIKPETLIKASSLRNKDELVEDIEQNQSGVPPQVAEEIKRIGEELQKQGEALKQKEQALAEQESQIASAKTDLAAQHAQFKADVTVAKAELTAQQKIFAAEQRVAQANRTASEADSEEPRPS